MEFIYTGTWFLDGRASIVVYSIIISPTWFHCLPPPLYGRKFEISETLYF